MKSQARPKTILSISQIDEIIAQTESGASSELWLALAKFLKAEKQKRINAGRNGGRKQTVADKKTANAEYQRKWRNKQKEQTR